MKLHELQPKQKKTPRKRRGQGRATGNGTFSGRGCKGQKARAGKSVRLGFEGGQSGILMRMPKWRGFKNPSKIEAQVLNLKDLEENFKENDKVNFKALCEKKLVKEKNPKVKILSNGELTKKLEISGLLVSKVAQEKIEKAGGKIS